MTIETAMFGPLDLTAEEYWEAEVFVSGEPVKVDLNVDDPGVPEFQVEAAISGLAEADSIAQTARQAIAALANQADDYPLGLYLQHHRDELTPQGLVECLRLDSAHDLSKRALAAKLKLLRIGAYPGSDQAVFVADFGLPGRVTDYLLAVKLDASRTVRAVDMES